MKSIGGLTTALSCLLQRNKGAITSLKLSLGKRPVHILPPAAGVSSSLPGFRLLNKRKECASSAQVWDRPEQSCRATPAPEAQASFPLSQRAVQNPLLILESAQRCTNRPRPPPAFNHLHMASLFCWSCFLRPCGSTCLFSLALVDHQRKQSAVGLSTGEVHRSLKCAG